jgi:hypothetical protein
MKLQTWLSPTPVVDVLTTNYKSALGHSYGKIVVRHREIGLQHNTHYVDNFRLI